MLLRRRVLGWKQECEQSATEPKDDGSGVADELYLPATIPSSETLELEGSALDNAQSISSATMVLAGAGQRRLLQLAGGGSHLAVARVALSVLSLSACCFLAGFYFGQWGEDHPSTPGRISALYAGASGASHKQNGVHSQSADRPSHDGPTASIARELTATNELRLGRSAFHGIEGVIDVRQNPLASPLPDMTSLPLGTRVVMVAPDGKYERLGRSPVRLLHVAGARAYSPDVSLNLITMRSFFETIMSEEPQGVINLTISFHMTNPEAAAVANESARRFVDAFVESTPGYIELGLLLSSGPSNAYVSEVETCDKDPECRYVIYLEDDHFMQQENLMGYTLKDYVNFFDSNPVANYLKWHSRPNIPIRQMPSCLECNTTVMARAGVQTDMPVCMTEHFAERIHMVRASFMAKAVRIGAVPANITHNLQATWPCAAAWAEDTDENPTANNSTRGSGLRRFSRKLQGEHLPQKQCEWEQWWMKCGYFMLGSYNHPQTSTHVDGKHFPGPERFWVDYNWIPQAAKMLGPRVPPTEETFDHTYEKNGHVRLFPPETESQRQISK